MVPRVAVPLAWLALLGATAPALALPAGGRAQGDVPWTVPTDLPQAAEDVRAGLDQVADASEIEQARRAHRSIAGDLDALAPHAVDLAGRSGELFATYRTQLARALADGNLSDARSLAGAAANLLEDEIRPRVDRWAVNRTALAPGPVRWSNGDPVVSVVLVNPPGGGLGAFDVGIAFEEARPTDAGAAVGRGEASVDTANRTARVASFSAQALANLDAGRQRLVLGEVQLDRLEPDRLVNATARVHELVASDGGEVPALGLASSSTVPERPSGLDVGAWWPIAALAVGALVLVALVRRLEV